MNKYKSSSIRKLDKLYIFPDNKNLALNRNCEVFDISNNLQLLVKFDDWRPFVVYNDQYYDIAQKMVEIFYGYTNLPVKCRISDKDFAADDNFMYDLPWDIIRKADIGEPSIILNDDTYMQITDIDNGRFYINQNGLVFDSGYYCFKTRSYLKENSELKAYINLPAEYGGYPYLSYGKNQIKLYTHRLIMSAWDPEFDINDSSITINHKDSCKYRSVLSNLEIATPYENSTHARANRLGQYRWSESEIRHICELLENGNSYTDVMFNLGLSKTKKNYQDIAILCRKLKHHSIWENITHDYDFSNI